MCRGIIALTILTLALAACSRDEPHLRHLKNDGNGPDEFSILPTKPLQTPENYNALPAPTPGASNLVDTHPTAEGIAALGGTLGAGGSGVAASDSGLVNHTRRYGVAPDVRQKLAVEDARIRRRHGRVNIFRLGPIDDYTTAYQKEWLDSQAEKQRLQRAGVVTPSSPPPE